MDVKLTGDGGAHPTRPSGKSLFSYMLMPSTLRRELMDARTHACVHAAVGTGDPEFDKVLRSPNWFDADKHLRMTYRSESVRFEQDVPVSVTGDLTLLGVTRPITFRISGVKYGNHPVTKKGLCGAEVASSLKRSEFGMKASLPSIGDDVQLTIQFEAFRD